jgi:predicted SAM-dependent methyltransferase
MDMFICTEVIEHMKPEFVEPWLRQAWKTLRTGGLAYISTPNADGSKATLPIDHVYEWKYEELSNLLRRYFRVICHHGTFIQMPNFKLSINRTLDGEWPDYLIEAIENRFDKNWQRVIFAVNHPKLANNVTWILRAK